MDSIQIQIIIIACLASVACVLPGVFLVLRGVALMSDAISHAILFGIALMFLIVQRLESPLLILGAIGAGLLTVACTESLISLRSLKKDAAIGIVFPLLFSIGVILISRYARNVHLDTDMILLGEIAFAPFNRLIIGGKDLGPYALWLLSGIVIINTLFITFFYKELKLVTFDHDLAQVLGFSPILLYYGLMTITSCTAVATFDIVGAIVVVALMITPAATAYLFTNQLWIMLYLSIFFGFCASIVCYWMAYCWDVSIAGSIATVTGIFFLFALLFSPEKGILAYRTFQRKRNIIIGKKMLCFYLAKKSDLQKFNQCCPEYIALLFNWKLIFLNKVIEQAQADDYISISQKDAILLLTEKGYEYSKS